MKVGVSTEWKRRRMYANHREALWSLNERVREGGRTNSETA